VAPGGNIFRNKAGKLVDMSRCGTYKGRAADESNYHKNVPTSNAPFDTSRDTDMGNIAVVYDDGTIVSTDANGTRIDFIRAVQKFYLTHPDVYDILAIWPNFNHAEGSFYINIKNGVRGLGQPIHDDSATYGTSHLEGFVNFRNYMSYPANPNDRLAGNNDTPMTLIAQESSHRWGAFVQFDADSSSRVRASTDLLGRDNAHWCYFSHVPAITGQTHSSSLEGNSWIDLGGNTFATTNAGGTGGLSELDQYLMGLRLPSEVNSTFYVQNPTGTSNTCASRPYTPEIDGTNPIVVSGSRYDVVIEDITRVEGERSPDATQQRHKLRMAFMLLAGNGPDVAQADIDKLNGLRTAWSQYYATETQGRGTFETALGPVDMDGDGENSDTDCNDADPNIYTGAVEVCNKVDDNCNELIDEDPSFDADGDGWTYCNGDCNDASAAIHPGATEIIGNGFDDDCDGGVDNATPVDNDFDGYSPPFDCNDNDPAVFPEGIELVDGIDNNCNGFLDCLDPDVQLQSEKGQRRNDGFDNDCNEIIDG